MKRKTADKVKKPTQKALKTVSLASGNDPQGSYTGVCNNEKYEKPVQDADDL